MSPPKIMDLMFQLVLRGVRFLPPRLDDAEDEHAKLNRRGVRFRTDLRSQKEAAIYTLLARCDNRAWHAVRFFVSLAMA
jgi:hypothetical protein